VSERAPTITRTTITVRVKRHGVFAPTFTEGYTLSDARELAKERAEPLNLPIIHCNLEDLDKQAPTDAVFVVTAIETLVAKEKIY
jgi:hypothetical protein